MEKQNNENQGHYMGIRMASMDGVGGMLREPKSMLIKPALSILYKATIFDTFLIVVAY